MIRQRRQAFSLQRMPRGAGGILVVRFGNSGDWDARRTGSGRFSRLRSFGIVPLACESGAQARARPKVLRRVGTGDGHLSWSQFRRYRPHPRVVLVRRCERDSRSAPDVPNHADISELQNRPPISPTFLPSNHGLDRDRSHADRLFVFCCEYNQAALSLRPYTPSSCRSWRNNLHR